MMAQAMTRKMLKAQRQMKRDYDQLKAAHGRLKQTLAEHERIIADLRVKLDQALERAGVRNLVQGYRDACNDMRVERDARQTVLEQVYKLAKGEHDVPRLALTDIAALIENSQLLPAELQVPLQG
jgi:hypothetical protein